MLVRQVKAARALLGWSQQDLARASGVSEPTIGRLEAADGVLGGRGGDGRENPAGPGKSRDRVHR
jgi:hypothetical protein